jgi:hypothetical protein
MHYIPFFKFNKDSFEDHIVSWNVLPEYIFPYNSLFYEGCPMLNNDEESNSSFGDSLLPF